MFVFNPNRSILRLVFITCLTNTILNVVFVPLRTFYTNDAVVIYIYHGLTGTKKTGDYLNAE